MLEPTLDELLEVLNESFKYVRFTDPDVKRAYNKLWKALEVDLEVVGYEPLNMEQHMSTLVEILDELERKEIEEDELTELEEKIGIA
jgi:hypothetical protein